MDSAQVIDIGYRLPDVADVPHCDDAEGAVIGAILYDNAQMERVAPFLTADAFFNPCHAALFAAAAELIGRGELADAIVLRARFDAHPVFDGLDAADYLGLLLEQAPPAHTCIHYARLVANDALRRRGIAVAADMDAALRDGNGPAVKAVLAEAGERVGALSLECVGQSAFVTPDDVAIELLDQRAPEQIPTGLRTLDPLFMLDRQAITLLAGHTSMGKSAVALEFARRVACNGYRVSMFSLEMNKWQVTARLLSATMAEGSSVTSPKGLPYFRIARPHGLADTSRDWIRQTVPDLPPIHIDATPGLTVSDMVARLAEQPDPPDLVVVDYVNIVSLSDMERGLRHDQMIGEVAARLRNLAKTRNCAVLLLCQLNRNSVSRDQKAPELSDLKDSSALEHAADTVLFAHRPEYFIEREVARIEAAGETVDPDLRSDLARARNRISIICAKQRMGPTGQRELRAAIAYNYITEGDDA